MGNKINERKLFLASGSIIYDPVGDRTWVEIKTEDGFELSVGFKGKQRKLDRYYLKTEDFTDKKYLAIGEWKK